MKEGNQLDRAESSVRFDESRSQSNSGAWFDLTKRGRSQKVRQRKFPPMIGRTIAHYKILEKLGEGGMGIVYRAEDTKLRRPVALKFLTAPVAAREVERDRFQREAQAAASWCSSCGEMGPIEPRPIHAQFAVERGHAKHNQLASRRPLLAPMARVNGWPFSTSTRTRSGATAVPANDGRMCCELSNGCDLATLAKNESISSWITSRPTYD
jgi:hypothetical protein